MCLSLVLSVKPAEAPLRLLAPESGICLTEGELTKESGSWPGHLPCKYDYYFRDMNIRGTKWSCPDLAGSDSREVLPAHTSPQNNYTQFQLWCLNYLSPI